MLFNIANEVERSKRIIFDKKHEDSIGEDKLKLLEKYEMDMNIRELSPKSIYNYIRDLKQFFSYLEKEEFNISIEDVTEDEIESFIFFCKKEGNNTERIKRRMSSIGAFYKFLRRKKLVKENPMEFMIRPKRGRPIVKQTYLTIEDVEKIRQWLKDQGNLQVELYVEMSLATMARVNAISNLTFSSCDMDEMMFNGILEKEQREVDLYFNDRVKSLLLKWKKEREKNGIESDYVFVNQSGEKVSVGTLQEWTKRVGIGALDIPLHPHDWRHSGATLLKNAGMALEDISGLLNHLSTDVTNKFYIQDDKSKKGKEFRKYTF